MKIKEIDETTFCTESVMESLNNDTGRKDDN